MPCIKYLRQKKTCHCFGYHFVLKFTNALHFNWPIFCCLQLQSYFFDSICIFSESESVQVFHSLYISVLLLEIQPLKGEGWDPINRFNPATIICLLHLPSQDLDFQQHMSWSFLCSMIWGQIDDCFVDISRMVENHCLNSLFLILPINLTYNISSCFRVGLLQPYHILRFPCKNNVWFVFYPHLLCKRYISYLYLFTHTFLQVVICISVCGVMKTLCDKVYQRQHYVIKSIKDNIMW